MTVLPHSLFRKVSLLARLVILVALIAALCTSFAVTPLVVHLPAHPRAWVRFFPPVWYLGLYQAMQGKAGPELAALGVVGLEAAAGVFTAAMLLGALSYRRYFQRIPESADSPQAVRRRPVRMLSMLLDSSILRNPMERACYHFGVRALLRSETHCILLGAFVGLGVVTASQMALAGTVAPNPTTAALPDADLLAAPLCVAYFLILGLRFAFEVPAGLASNWIFRLSLTQGKLAAKQVARKLVWTFLLPGVVLPTCFAFSLAWGFRIGLVHTAVVLALSLLLLEILLLRFRKIPFSCALPGFQNHAIVLILVFILGFWCFTALASLIERWMLGNPIRFVALPIFLGVAWYVLGMIRDEAEELGDELVYETETARAVQTLNILGTA